MDCARRRFVRAASLAALTTTGCARLIGRRDDFDAIVTHERCDGAAPVFASVRAAIDAASSARTTPWRIRIAAGTWKEKLVIDKPDIHLVGAGRGKSILSFDAVAANAGPDGQPLGTWRCASVIVRAPGFRATRLRIENSFDYVKEILHPTLAPIGPNGAQAVALMLDSGSDRARFDDVDISGHQDTLFVDAGRCLFRDCRIAGSVDFVFGAGQCVIDRCEIVSRYRPGKQRQGFICAPSTPSAQRYGLVFRSCRLHKEADIPPRTVALGRPWRPARAFADGRYGDPAVRGSAAFIDCWMDDHIDSAGWDPMAYTARDGSRVMFAPGDARFGEFGSRGPGVASSAARPRLTDAEMYTPASVLASWDSDADH